MSMIRGAILSPWTLVAHWDLVPEPATVEQSDLLKQLRIDRGPARAPRRRGRLLAILALLVLAAGVGLWLGWARLRPPVVQTTVARAAAPGGAAGSVLDASGYVTARRQATVSAKITGKVTEVLIEEGMRVKEGAVLARLDDTEARAAARAGAGPAAAARSQLAEIRAQLDQAERDYARQQELVDRQLVSAQALDAALAQRDMLRARLASTEEQVRVAQESVAVAQVQLDNTVVRAPFSGVVDRQGRAARRDDLADLGRRRLHPHRHRHHRGHGLARDPGRRQRGLHQPRARRSSRWRPC